MKKTVVIGLVVTLLGVVLFSIGLGHGGAKTVYWDHGFTTESYAHVDSHQTSSQYDGIKNFDLSTDSPVQIKKGDVSKVEVTYPSATKITKSGDTLHFVLKLPQRRHSVIVFGSDFQRPSKSVGKTVITVPQDIEIGTITSNVSDSISVHNLTIKTITSSGVGDITLDHVVTKGNLNLDNTGDTTLSHSRFPNAKLDVGAGDVTLTSNTFKTMNVKTGAGDIDFNQQNVAESFTAKSYVGDIDGKIARNKKTQVSVSADVGDVSVFGSSHKKQILSSVKHPVIYKFTSDVGDVDIH